LTKANTRLYALLLQTIDDLLLGDWEPNGQGNSSCGLGSARWDIWSFGELELGTVQYPLEVALFCCFLRLASASWVAFEAAQNNNNQALLDIDQA